jgi:GntR family transcriptional regulator
LLRDEGLVESEKGRGTFVLPALRQAIFPAAYLDPVEAGEQYPWMTEAARREQRGSSRLLDVAEVDAPAQVAAALDLKEQERPKVVRRVLMMLINDSPAELVNLYYPIDLARGTPLVESKRIKGGTPRVLTDMGYAPVAVVDEVSARASTSEEYELLNLSAEVPVLRTFRVAYTAERRPVEVSVLVKASNLYTLVYEVKCHHCSERTEE